MKTIRRATRKHYSAEEKIRIVLDGLRGESSIAELCRREGIAEGLYYSWSKEFLEAGKRRLAGDTAYGSAEMLQWLVHEHGIEPHIPVFDRSKRDDHTFSRSDFAFDVGTDTYRCPGGKQLKTTGTAVNDGTTLLYRASKHDCQPCALKPRCCPKEPARKVPRSIYEGARDLARDIATTEAYAVSRRQRKKVEMLFAHLNRILRLDRLRLRGPKGARDEFLLAATEPAQARQADPGPDARTGHINGATRHHSSRQKNARTLSAPNRPT